jgi:hypothetical protein
MQGIVMYDIKELYKKGNCNSIKKGPRRKTMYAAM